MTTPRIAFFSPLRPVRSGITDYSHELLPELSARAEVRVVRDEPRHAPLEGVASIALDDFRPLPDEMPVYQIGNSLDHHGFMVPSMGRYPGVLVLHDCCLQYLMLGLTLRRGDWRGLIDTLRPIHGAETPRVARRLLAHTVDPNDLSFAYPLIAASRGVIVHSELARRLVLGWKPDAHVAVIAMGVPLPERRADPAELKRRYGYADSDFVVASISTLAHTKRTEVLVDAVARLAPEHPGLRLLIAGGGGTLSADLKARLEGPLAKVVRWTGWLPAEEYNDFIALADIVADLRFAKGAETSASLTRAIAAGKGALLRAQGTFLEWPDEFTLKIRGGSDEVEEVASALHSMLRDRGRAARMGEAAWQYARAHLTLALAAEKYAAFAAEMIRVPAAPSAIPGTSGQGSPLLAAAFKLSRMLYLQRHYGWSGLRKRLGEELRRRPQGATPS